MINRTMLNKALSQIATNSIGTLQAVDGSSATVVIENQVYPDVKLIEVYEGVLDPNGEYPCAIIPFQWEDYIGRQVLITFLNRSLTEAVVVGVVK